MPSISDKRLNAPENRFVLVAVNQTVRDALKQWHDVEDLPAWAWLIIEYGVEEYRAIGAHDLRELVQNRRGITLNTRLLSLPEDTDTDPTSDYLQGYIEVRAVSRNMYGDMDAANMALRSPGRLVCVMEGHVLAGIVTRRPEKEFAEPSVTIADLLDED